MVPKPGGPLALAAVALVIPKRRRPPCLSGGGLGGPKAKEAPAPQRRGPRWSQSEGGPHASAAGASVIPKRRRPPCLRGEGASVIPKRRRPPRLSGGGLGDTSGGGPLAKGGPLVGSAEARGPRWSQSDHRGPLAQRRGPR